MSGKLDGKVDGKLDGMVIRDASEGDLPAILDIHNEAILNTTAIWSYHTVDLANRAALLAERQAKGYAFLVAEDGTGALMGYASFGDFRPHDGYCRTVEHSVYVQKGHHRKGIARALMLPLIEAARSIGKHAMIGGVDATNKGSIALHESLGFFEAGRLPEVGWKFERTLDLVFLQKLLD